MTDETLDIKNPSIMGKMMGNCHTITRLISFSYEQPLTAKHHSQRQRQRMVTY